MRSQGTLLMRSSNCQGSEFRGFHIRFKDVARGGIRIILSKGKERVFFPKMSNANLTRSLPGLIRLISVCCECADRHVVTLNNNGLTRFDENYALASTQSLKNKDIPEGW